jgi:flavin-dependent dehydrogenase
MNHQCDVLVVGGGPAGCATAIALHQLGVQKILLVEASDYGSARIGESIPPNTVQLLAELGLGDSFTQQGHQGCAGSCSSWGADELGYNDFLVNPRGNGWHLDRLRFDQWLVEQVELRGIEVCRNQRFRRLLPVEPGEPFVVEFEDPRRKRQAVAARFLVDATGRTARLAQALGARPQVDDQLFCVAGYLDTTEKIELAEHTLLEAVEYGWWYAARLSDNRITVAVASDLAIIREQGLTHSDGWRAAMTRTRHVAAAAGSSCLVQGSLRTWLAPSMLLDPPSGAGWLGVGDAASSYDPISSQGIYKAIADGLAAAPAIVAWLQGEPTGLRDYRMALGARYLRYQNVRSYFYAVERRWADAPFWRHRRANSLV